jgi:2'-5' RNA ligase
MNNLVIVAIPEQQDRVWKVSSEKVPHLTLLFLGEADTNPDLQTIIDFVEHAVTVSEHGPFYLEVDKRGVLGPDNADVLFFDDRRWNMKWIDAFRTQLLQNNQIRTAFDSAQQYEEWQPHLTLGYPTAPAKTDKEDYPFYSVCFDRIAVWNTDFAGPEFELEWPDRMEGDLAIAYSDTKKLEMVHTGRLSAPVQEESMDTVERGKEFVAHEASVLDNPTLAEQIKAKVQSILDDVTGDADNDVKLFGDPLVRAKIQSVLNDFYKDPNVDSQIVYDALGQAFIEHYGIRGMRWGVRKDSSSGGSGGSGSRHAVAPTAKSKIPAGNRRKTKLKTQGGQNHPAHPDAVQVALAKAKLKKSGTHALSNQELRDVANRVQLENQVKLLTSHRGKQFVTRQLQNEGSNLARAGIREGAKRGAKKAGVSALAAA